MLKILPIIPSSTSQKFTYSIILILFSYHYLLFPYYSFTLMVQVRIDIYRNKNLICISFAVDALCKFYSDTNKMVNESHPCLFLN